TTVAVGPPRTFYHTYNQDSTRRCFLHCTTKKRTAMTGRILLAMASLLAVATAWPSGIRGRSSSALPPSCLQTKNVVLSSSCDDQQQQKTTHFAFTMEEKGSARKSGRCFSAGES
ncbi:unnamed protein product, partial [Pylaiella littoralis]